MRGTFRWFLPLLIVLLLACSLFACGSKPAASPAPAATQPAPVGDTLVSIQESAPPTPPAIPQEVATIPPTQPLPPPSDPSDQPADPVRLIFIHHSTGGNWLADTTSNELGGGLGRALMENHYFVSATNYGWGPDGIGDRTDIGNWWEWFRGPSSLTYLDALYAESGQNFGDFGSWPRLLDDLGGENQVIVFKSCFPNSALQGGPSDPIPPIDANPLRGQYAYSAEHAISNAKGIYIDLLDYFRTRPDKLFIVVAAPPLSDPTWAENARLFNDWLVNEWLADYPLQNVAVFDFFSLLTNSGNTLAYPSGDDHPNRHGNEKATATFVPWLNLRYNSWAAAQGQPSLAGVSPTIQPPAASSEGSAAPTPAVSLLPSNTPLLQPADLTYLGAFRLPDGDDRPLTFEYGGNAMTFRPGADPEGDGFPGSLFITGHDRLPYGELADGSRVAEISIPAPLDSPSLDALPFASTLQDFTNVAASFFVDMDEIPKIGLAYLDHPLTGPLIHIAWGLHIQPPDTPSHAWFRPALSDPQMRGTWFIDDINMYSVNGYMFEIPATWADQYTGGQPLATGRMRDGGQGGMGPALFAYHPWQPDGSAPPPETRLPATTLLLYENADSTPNIEHNMTGYQHPDEWEGGAWLTTTSGKSAVIFAGTKATGSKYWYGFIHPDGPQYVCVDPQVIDFTTCRLADGSPCPPVDLEGCCSDEAGECASNRGWWSTRFDAQIIFYNPDDLRRVALGELEPWQPQPYAALDIDDLLYFNALDWDRLMLGWGDQRRYRIGDVAFDRQNGLLYVLELFGDGAKPVAHVWRLAP